MADVTRLCRETLGAGYYRRHPAEALRYGLGKLRFARHQISPDQLLVELGFDPLRARRGLARWADELNGVLARVAERNRVLGFDQGAVSYEGAVFEYCLVRSLRPDVVIETGVAAGVSTSFIGAALLENGHGTLVSIDLPPQALHLDDGARFDWRDCPVGWAIPACIRCALGSRHRLILEDVRTALPRVLDEFAEIDCFIHDDLHTPDHMHWQFDLVWPHLRPGGVIVADDLNHGWTSFAKLHGLEQHALLNTQRLGALQKRAR